MPPGTLRRWHRAGAAAGCPEGVHGGMRSCWTGSPAYLAPACPPTRRHLLSPGRSSNPRPNPSGPPGPLQDAQRPPPPLPPALPSLQAPRRDPSWLLPLCTRGHRGRDCEGCIGSAARGCGRTLRCIDLSDATHGEQAPAAANREPPGRQLSRRPRVVGCCGQRCGPGLTLIRSQPGPIGAWRACLPVALGGSSIAPFPLQRLGVGQLLGGVTEEAGGPYRAWPPPLWSQGLAPILWVPALTRFSVAYVAPSTENIPPQCCLLNLRSASVSSEVASSASFPCLPLGSCWPMPPSHNTYPTCHHPKEVRPEGSGQRLLLSVCLGPSRGSLKRMGGPGQLGVGPGRWRLNPVLSVPLIAAGLARLGACFLLYLPFSCGCSCCADSRAPAAGRIWEHGLPRGRGGLGASGLQNGKVCEDPELAGGRLAEVAAAGGHGLRGGVRERLLGVLAGGRSCEQAGPAGLRGEGLTLQGLGWWLWNRSGGGQKEGSPSV